MIIAVSQRVCIELDPPERRDAVDQRLVDLLIVCGVTALPIPNNPAAARKLLSDIRVEGIVLSGGNTLGAYGGDAPERDDTETLLFGHALGKNLPVLGMCRGMQFIQHRFGVALKRVPGHVAAGQTVLINGVPEEVNSFHTFGTKHTVPDLEVWARSDDGLVKAVRHTRLPVLGIMWHPERITPFAKRDIMLIKRLFTPL